MRLPYFQVDVFTPRTFGGNAAGVCPLREWLPTGVMQTIAAENNLAETAFYVPAADGFELRWFTPTMEIDLCGHATIAPALVLFQEYGLPEDAVRFHTRSGLLTAARREGFIELDFPARPGAPCPVPPPALAAGLGRTPVAVFKARDYLAVFSSAEAVAALRPDFRVLAEVDCLGVIATAPGAEPGTDFVSRFFAPRAGVDEDPATGSSHCTLIPYWAGRLDRTKMFARQLSRRGGEIHCEFRGERVGIGGAAVVYSRGELTLPG